MVMKKIAAILFLIIVICIGVVSFLHEKKDEFPAASDFIPRNEGVTSFVLVGLDKTGSLMEDLGNGIEFMFSGLEGYFQGNSNGYIDLIHNLSGKLHDSAPVFQEMNILFSVRPNGIVFEPFLRGAVALNTPDPEKFMDMLMDDLSEACPGLVIIPYNAELGERADPLYQVMDMDTGFTIHTALFGDKPSYLLFSTGEEGLGDMLQAAVDETARLDISRHYQERDFVHLEVDNSIFKAVLANQGRKVQSEEPFILEAIFISEGRDRLMKLYSNGAELFLTPLELHDFSPVSPVENLFGGGRVLGFAMARMLGFDEQYFQAILAGQEAEEAKTFLEYLEHEFHITLQDLVDILSGEALMVIGGKASSSIGDIPGLYLLLKPFKEGIAEKFVSLVPALDIPLMIKSLQVPGWKMVYALDHPITLTLAAREKELMIGILDAGEILNLSEVPPNISPFLTGRNFGVCAFSVRDIAETLDDLIRRIQFLQPDPVMDQTRLEIDRILRRIETVSCTSISPEESVLRITVIEEERP